MTKKQTDAFDQIMAGAQNALAFAQGDVHTGKAHEIKPVDVMCIRKKTGLSQSGFSKVFHISIGTLRNWEQGRRRPEGPAIALLEIIDKEPDAAMRALHAGV